MMVDDGASMNVLTSPVMFIGPVQSGIVPTGTRQEVFQLIFWVFLVLGTLVGVVVIGYMLYTGYKYRESADRESAGATERPELGELPEGGGGGRKLAVSLTLSAIIVISLIAWTYGTLLYVEQGSASAGGESLQVNVTGYQFGWEFEYPNGHTTDGTLRVPQGERVALTVTSRDVFHNFGIPALKTKADAIPGQTTDTWFRSPETGTYRAQCFELCGTGHSAMNAEVIVMEPAAYEQWYANTAANNSTAGNTTTA